MATLIGENVLICDKNVNHYLSSLLLFHSTIDYCITCTWPGRSSPVNGLSVRSLSDSGFLAVVASLLGSPGNNSPISALSVRSSPGNND